MSTIATLTQQPRTNKRQRVTPASAGLPDPRPVTEFETIYEEVDSHSRLTVKLGQPCIIRAPAWGFVNCDDGSRMYAGTVTPVGTDSIVFDFDDVLPGGVAFIDVPYQDVQVQNFQGGFVRPGGTWFRAPK